MEARLYDMLGTTGALSRFVNAHWVDAETGTIGDWKAATSPQQRWFEAKFTVGTRELTLQMDVLRGTFMVNGQPVSRLPTSITQHPDYIQVFGQNIFDVQPGATVGVYVTTTASKRGTFTFQLTASETPELVVINRRKVGKLSCKFRFIPSQHFQGDIPHMLRTKHSHWLEIDEDAVYFRPLSFEDPLFEEDTPEAVPYKLCLNKEGWRILEDVRLERRLVDVRSFSFLNLYRIFGRLEDKGYFHIYYAPNGQVTCHLPRLGLTFLVDEDSEHIRSLEHDGMLVDPDQNLNCLVGLQHGLVLCSENASNRRKILVPFGTSPVKLVLVDGYHVAKLDVSECSRIFEYDINSELQMLQSESGHASAWLYLAYLHAATSNPFPDPFTGMTGSMTFYFLSVQFWLVIVILLLFSCDGDAIAEEWSLLVAFPYCYK